MTEATGHVTLTSGEKRAAYRSITGRIFFVAKRGAVTFYQRATEKQAATFEEEGK